MSGIAEVFLNQGYRVSGSDLAESESTKRISGFGAKIMIGHRAENVHGAHVLVVSSAIKLTNPEIQAAKALRVPVIPRAEMLGELMRGKTGIAVAGSHGKTTTTSMLATVMTVAGLDPTIVIGGRVDSLGGNAKLGRGSTVVAEADESDGSFLHLPATYGIITNIDNDHLDHFGNIGAIEEAFVEFVGKLPFYGAAAICMEDPGVKRCLHRFHKPVITYGFSENCDFFARNIVLEGLGSHFDVYDLNKSRFLGHIRLNVPGKHNVLNSLAAIAIGIQLDIPFAKIEAGLTEFRGVKRRFEIRWKSQNNKRVIVDDYGHHPTEIAATLAAAKTFWPGRIVTVFQPHRFTRTLNCHDAFLTAFHLSDVVLLTDIYAAGEDPIEGVSTEALADDIRAVALPHQEVQCVGKMENARTEILKRFADNDLVLCMGAGSITKLPEQIIQHLT